MLFSVKEPNDPVLSIDVLPSGNVGKMLVQVPESVTGEKVTLAPD
jgi:hypothetical protein